MSFGHSFSLEEPLHVLRYKELSCRSDWNNKSGKEQVIARFDELGENFDWQDRFRSAWRACSSKTSRKIGPSEDSVRQVCEFLALPELRCLSTALELTGYTDVINGVIKEKVCTCH